MINATTQYRQITRDIGKTMSRLASTPEIKREVEYYQSKIHKIKSADEFLADQRLYSFAMTAFGMKDLIYAKGMIKKVLSDGIDNPSAFALNVADQRFREFAQVFNFKSLGGSTTSFDRAQKGTVERYLRNTLEERAGQSSEAVRLALYFDRKAPSIATEYGILADKAIFAVVRTAIGMPDSAAAGDIDKLAKVIGQRVNLSDFADPVKRNEFITRYFAMNEAKAGVSSNTTIALYSGTPSPVDMNTLMSIQSLKRYGA